VLTEGSRRLFGVMIAIATADVVLQALAYDDSFEAVTLYGLLAMGGRGGGSLVAPGNHQPTDQ